MQRVLGESLPGKFPPRPSEGRPFARRSALRPHNSALFVGYEYLMRIVHMHQEQNLLFSVRRCFYYESKNAKGGGDAIGSPSLCTSGKEIRNARGIITARGAVSNH